MSTFDPDGLRKRIAELEAHMGEPGFWDDQRRAAGMSAEHARLGRRLARYEGLQRESDDAAELLELDAAMIDDVAEMLVPLKSALDGLQLEALFSGEYDGGDAVVGNDSAGDVAYLNMATGETYGLGFGGAPVLSDDMHAYWRGVDGAIYEGTVSLPSAASVGTVRALKASGSNTVYLVKYETKAGEKFTIPSEKTYFTWFSSWKSVETVSAATLASYADGGTATFAPGTKVKISGDAKVYVVGNDNALHWVTSETAAYSIFGVGWNKGILNITQQDLVTNPLGASVDSENALKSV